MPVQVNGANNKGGPKRWENMTVAACRTCIIEITFCDIGASVVEIAYSGQRVTPTLTLAR